MNTRLKALRKSLNLTQQAFADKLGIKRNTVATYETGKSNPSDSAVCLICRQFNVREEWLRNGTGEMFAPIDKENELMQWAASVLKDESDSFKKRYVKMLMSLNEDDWKALERQSLLIANENKDID